MNRRTFLKISTIGILSVSGCSTQDSTSEKFTNKLTDKELDIISKYSEGMSSYKKGDNMVKLLFDELEVDDSDYDFSKFGQAKGHFVSALTQFMLSAKIANEIGAESAHDAITETSTNCRHMYEGCKLIEQGGLSKDEFMLRSGMDKLVKSYDYSVFTEDAIRTRLNSNSI